MTHFRAFSLAVLFWSLFILLHATVCPADIQDGGFDEEIVAK